VRVELEIARCDSVDLDEAAGGGFCGCVCEEHRELFEAGKVTVAGTDACAVAGGGVALSSLVDWQGESF